MSRTPAQQIVLLHKFAAMPLAPDFTPDKLAEGCFADIGEALENAADDAEAEAIFQAWLAKYPHIKLDINPIDGVMVDAMCTGPSPLATRGVPVKKYGEASVVAALKSRGYASLTALKPTLPLEKKDDGKKKSADDKGSTNPWSDKMRFPNDADGSKRLAAKMAFMKAAGSKAAIALAASAGFTFDGKPLRK